MFNETRNQAIDRLKKEGYETLYVVECHITDQQKLASTWLWSIYANLEDARRWAELCREYHKSQDYYWEFYDWSDLPTKKDYLTSYFYNDGHSEMIEEFKLTVVA